MHCIQPKTIEMKLIDPIDGILDDEFANDVRALGVVIHRGSPRGLVPLSKDW